MIFGIIAILSAIALGYMAAIITGKWAGLMRLALVALAVLNTLVAAGSFEGLR